MSLPLHRFFLTDPFTTPRGWAIVAPGTTAGATFYLHNQTDTSMDVYGDGSDSEYLGTIPAELGFFAIHPRKGYLSLEFRPGTVLNASSAPSAYVDGQYFAPGEADPGYPMIGLSRLVNVGNSLTVSNATLLQGTGQNDGVTTHDETVGSTGGAALIPANVQPGGSPLMLFPIDASGNVLVAAGILIAPALTTLQNALALGGAITQLAGKATAGALGVAGIIGAPGPTPIIVTTAVNVLDMAPPAAGFYRASVHALINNGVSGNAITFSLTYRDAAGTARTNFFAMQSGSTFLTAAGVSSFGNAGWASEPLCFYAGVAGNITFTYRDPTNTPNDTVNVILERLA